MNTQSSSAIFYLRVSTDRQADGAAAQLELLRGAAHAAGIFFAVSAQELARAVQSRLHEVGPLYLDFGISGYFDSTRPGYQKFLHRALNDASITHVFTPARDRLARPEDAADFASREHRIRAAGKTLVVGTKVLPPLQRGDDTLVDSITASLEYSQGRAYLGHLANKMVAVKANKAKAGCWTGGRAPYGFVRVLVDAQGNVERALKNGESVRQPGCSVSLRVGNVEHIRIWHDVVLRDFDPAGNNLGGKHIAKRLNVRGIPSPDAGRVRRTRYEESRVVPGTWTQGMVFALVDNPALMGLLRYGKRGVGEHARLGENGLPRKLTQAEAPVPGAPAKIVENAEDIQIITQGGWLTEDDWLLDVQNNKCFEVDRSLWRRCQDKRKENAGAQKGVARCRSPFKYPLAGMVWCAHCGSVMHGVPNSEGLRYCCGTYVNSGNAKCDHNWVYQEDLLAKVLDSLRKSALPHVNQLRATLEKLFEEQRSKESSLRAPGNGLKKERDRQEKAVQKALEAVSQAQDEDEREGLRKIYRRERANLEGLEAELRRETILPTVNSTETLIEAALKELQELRCKLDQPTDRKEIAELLHAMNVRVWLKFKKVPWGKRVINKLESGVLYLGTAAAPDSSSKVNRGDRI